MTQEHFVKGIIWLVPVIFGAGGVYSQTQSTVKQVKSVEQSVKRIESSLSLHEKKPQHETGAVEVKYIKINQSKMMKRQSRIIENLGAICQATNAKCR
tara:strand:+ start:268 stop:561 length:294 start_codon:yes stop_codon:yes gene_type:complete